MKSWNSNSIIHAGNPATEVFVGWENYLNGSNWFGIDCSIVEVPGVGFEVTKAPFNFSAPYYADGEAYFASDNQFDVFTKSIITAPEFGAYIRPLAVAHVLGQIADINGDGRYDAIVYPNAYPQWGADLIYYIKHGIAPEMQELVRFSDGTLLPATDFFAQFVIRPTGHSEFTPEVLADSTLSRVQQIWNPATQGAISHNNGFYVRALNESQKRGTGIKNIAIWDSADKRQSIAADIAVYDAANFEFVLTKHIPVSFFSGATYPVFTDATSTFYPDAGTAGPGVDGMVGAAGGNNTFNTLRTMAANSNDPLRAQEGCYLKSGTTSNTWNRLDRIIFNIDMPIPAGDTISAATLYVTSHSKRNDLSGENSPNSTDVLIQTNSATDNNLALADYLQHATVYNTVFAESQIQANVTVGAEEPFVLNAAGISFLNTAQMAKMGITSRWDLDNTTTGMTWASGVGQFLYWKMSDAGGTLRPRLVLTHAPATTPMPLQLYNLNGGML